MSWRTGHWPVRPPSAAIVDTIMHRKYVRVEKRQLVPTPLGEKVVDLLTGSFTFLDYEFTKAMEDNLDAIAPGARPHTVK